MEFCPKCGTRLLAEKIRVKKEEPKYTKVWEYGKGWQVIEEEAVFMIYCPNCFYRRREKELKHVEAKRAPKLEMPLSNKRYYPSYMSPGEYFRDEMRQTDMVESITQSAREKKKKQRTQ